MNELKEIYVQATANEYYWKTIQTPTHTHIHEHIHTYSKHKPTSYPTQRTTFSRLSIRKLLKLTSVMSFKAWNRIAIQNIITHYIHTKTRKDTNTPTHTHIYTVNPTPIARIESEFFAK